MEAGFDVTAAGAVGLDFDMSAGGAVGFDFDVTVAIGPLDHALRSQPPGERYDSQSETHSSTETAMIPYAERKTITVPCLE